MIKTCGKCKELKSITEFYSKGKNRIQSYCKNCLLASQKERWNRTKTYLVILCGSKCSKCGISGHPAIFDFHHIDGKEFTISHNRGLSLQKLIIEVQKCVLVCACCHRLEHINSENWNFDFKNPLQYNITMDS